MRLEHLHVRGLGPFDDITVDFAALGRLVAITGENGAGKSTLVELLMGVMFRTCPTRGSLGSLATRRDSLVEARVVNGSAYQLRHLVDAVSGKGEAVAMDGDGRALTSSGKLREFDSWAAKHLPRSEVLLASTFAAQGGHRRFIDLSAGERKAVLLRVLGIEHLEVIAELARGMARERRESGQVLRARITDTNAGASVPDAAARLEERRSVAKALTWELSTTREQLEAVKVQADAAEAGLREHAEHRAKLSRLEEQRSSILGRLADAETRLENNRGVLEQAGVIRQAQADAAQLDEAMAAQSAAVRELEVRIVAVRGELGAAERNLEAVNSQQVDARATEGDARDVLRDAVEVAGAVDAVPTLEGTVLGLRRALAMHEDGEREATDEVVQEKEGRIAGLREGLTTIDAGTVAAEVVARATLDDDDIQALVVADAAVWLAGPAAVERVRLQRDLSDAVRQLSIARRLADRAPEMKRAQVAADKARADHDRIADELVPLEALVIDGIRCVADVNDEHRRAADELVTTRSRREGLDGQLRHVEQLTRAEARLEELGPVIDQHRAEMTKVQAELEAHGPAYETSWVVPDMTGHSERLAGLETDAANADKRVAVAEADLGRAQEAGARVGELEFALATVDEELADYNRVARDCGRDGIQALEIDAAGPELTELVNDLLHSCVSRRWTVQILTTRLASDGKRELEGCDVMVVDTENGREATVETFSGGERVLIGEAVSLALSVLACRRAGVERPTLVRDESGAALDGGNGRRYVAMLRRAADLIDASQVLYITHDVELQALADARLHVAGGTVEVRS